MVEEMKEAKETVTLSGMDVHQFSNAIEYALGNYSNQSAPGELVWFLGWQLGQVRPALREFQASMNEPRIRELEKAIKSASTEKKTFVESGWMDAIGMKEAAMQREYSVRIGRPKREWFSGELIIAFAKVISYLDVDE